MEFIKPSESDSSDVQSMYLELFKILDSRRDVDLMFYEDGTIMIAGDFGNPALKIVLVMEKGKPKCDLYTSDGISIRLYEPTADFMEDFLELDTRYKYNEDENSANTRAFLADVIEHIS